MTAPRIALLVAATVIVASPNRTAAQTADCEPGATEAFLDGNAVRAKILNNGALFWNGGDPVYQVGGSNGIFATSMVFGGLVDGEIRMAASTYGPYEFWPGPVDSVRAGIPCAQFDRIYEVSRDDLEALDGGASPTRDIRDWPWHLGAPVVDGDGNPNNYNLTAGDRPELLGRESLFWIMNDVGGLHDRTETEPLGIEVHTMAFAESSSDPLIHRSTFYRFRLFNRNDTAIDEAYFGIFVDPDLGAPFDDYVGSDSLAGMGYVYNADNDDDGRYGTPPPAIGFKMFEGPVGLSDGYDNDYDGVVDEPDERLGMSSFIFYNGGGGVQGDPAVGTDFYNYMQSRWRDGLQMTEGGDGRDFSRKPVRYMFPADPGDFWSELNADNEGTAISPADRRFIQGMGPFRLDPGESEDIFVGILYARGSDNLESVSVLREGAISLNGISPRDIEGSFVPVSGETPRIVRPGDNATDLPTDALFEWTLSGMEPRFHVELRNVDTGQIRLIETTDMLRGFDLEPNTSYSWRVREFTVDENGPWSPRRTFQTSGSAFGSYQIFTGFEVVSNAGGSLDPPQPAAALFADFPVIDRPGPEQQVGEGIWFIHTDRDDRDGSYETFVSNVLADHAATTLLGDYEIRYTGTSVAVDESGVRLSEPLPFEIWHIGKGTPDVPDDDIRLIPVVADAEGDGWGLRAVDHPVSSWTDDPFTDRFTVYEPKDRSPGQAGYEQFVAGLDAGADAADLLGAEVLTRLVLVSWNGSDGPAEDGMFVQDLPEEGTVFRITTGSIPAPALVSPGDGQAVPVDPLTYYWMDTPVDRSDLELARSPDFIDHVDIIEDVEPGLTLDPLPEGTYFWRIRGSLGLSPTWSFTVAAGVSADDDPAEPAEFEIGRPYPNPARETVTLPLSGRAEGAVTIELFDALGRRVSVLETDGERPIRLDVSGLSAGVYMLRTEADGRQWTRSIVVRR